MLRAALARRNPRNHFGAVLDHLTRMKAAFAASQALHNDLGFFINQNAHRAPPASATILSAPSFISLAIVKLQPESRKISWPFSTLVPSIRITTGSLRFNSLAAATTPFASTSQRKIPPKMLMNTPFTLL